MGGRGIIMEMDCCLTVGQFAGRLEKIVYGAMEGTGRTDCDVAQQPEELIKRRTAAGIIHQVLLRTGEADEQHIEASLCLRGIFKEDGKCVSF